jgi:hypothetical protein
LNGEDFQKIGQLAVRWSHIDQVIGNCLKALLRLPDEEAMIIVFPLGAEARLDRIKQLVAKRIDQDKVAASLSELLPVMKGIQFVRNSVIHSIVIDDTTDGHIFHLRSKDRVVTKAQVFSAEELTNYAGHCVLALRFAIGGPNLGNTYTMPERPPIPEFLRHLVQFPR